VSPTLTGLNGWELSLQDTCMRGSESDVLKSRSGGSRAMEYDGEAPFMSYQVGFEEERSNRKGGRKFANEDVLAQEKNVQRSKKAGERGGVTSARNS